MRSRSHPPRVSRLARARAALVAAPLAAAALACGGSDDPVRPPDPSGAAADTVFMPGEAFSPFLVTIRAGESVAWDFPGDQHNVIFAARSGAPANILPTRSAVVTRRFDAVGTFPYDCTLHAGMTGEIVVER